MWDRVVLVLLGEVWCGMEWSGICVRCGGICVVSWVWCSMEWDGWD